MKINTLFLTLFSYIVFSETKDITTGYETLGILAC